jgi:hypothetical protein
MELTAASPSNITLSVLHLPCFDSVNTGHKKKSSVFSINGLILGIFASPNLSMISARIFLASAPAAFQPSRDSSSGSCISAPTYTEFFCELW